MRSLEIAFLIANLPPIGWMFVTPPPLVGTRLAAAITVLIAGAHGLLEGIRWQMLPAYILSVLLCAWELWQPLRLGAVAGVTSLGCLLMAACLSALVPVFDFPPLTGAFPVGTVLTPLKDSTRAEAFSGDPGATRELMIQIWYPAAGQGSRARYAPSAEHSFKKSHLALVQTHASSGPGVSPRQARYPLLIFCPSWTGGKSQNTFQVEELASHGFIVVGLDHPYGTSATYFPDGRVIGTRLGSWLELSSEETLRQSMRIAENELLVRARDAMFVRNTLAEMNDHDPRGLLTGRIDLERTGIFGHSFGGAVAAQVCVLDSRFRAGIDMDGLLFGEAADAGVRQPFFFMSDDTPVPESDLDSPNPPRRRNAALQKRDAMRIRQSLTRYGGYDMTISGTFHMNFCDSPLYSRLKRFTGAGPIDAARAMRIVNDYTLAFFQQHLNGVHQPLLDGPSPDYPEARFRRWPRP